MPASGVKIRVAQARDAAEIAEVYAPYVRDTAATFEQDPPDENEIRARMRSAPGLPWLVAERQCRVVGYAYASRHRERPAYRWSVEVSVYLIPAEGGRGTARALYGRLFSELRDLGYISALAAIALPNAASVGLHEAMGFAAVGAFHHVGFKHGRWHDVGWWQRALTRPPATPKEPLVWRTAASD